MKIGALFSMIRKPNPDTFIPGFDAEFYKSEYSDVAGSGLSPAQHYIKIGRVEHRDPNAYFSAKGYLHANPDVAAAHFDPLSHFMLHGIAQNYGGWNRQPGDKQFQAPKPPPAVGQTGGITALIETFRTHLRTSIKDLERRRLAEPDNRDVQSTLDYWWFHERRWNMTFKTIAPFVEQTSSILEVGGSSNITDFLAIQGIRTAVTNSDLRETIPYIVDESHDVVLCLEVIEHIKDQDGSLPIDIFNETGVHCLVSEMRRILKPGGVVVCTTPNGCSYSSIARSIRMEPPMFLRKHVREFTPDELRERFETVGFETVSLQTPPEPWGQRDDLNIEAVERMVIRAGGSTEMREDDIVAVFRRRH